MSHFIFNTPEQRKPSQDQFEFHPKDIEKKISTLPMANQKEAIQQLFDLLYQLNRQQIDTAMRYQIMELIRPSVIELCHTIRKPYIRNPLPLSTEDLATAYQIQTLLTEMAFAYKTLTIELLVSDTDDDETNDIQLQHSIYHAITFLSKLLVECYQIYSPLPEGTWHEMHRLYLLAEGFSLQSKSLQDGENNHSITEAYLCISLLGLANPYHLMQRETVKIYEKIRQWVPLCRITVIDENTTEGFISNFDSDTPARFVKFETLDAHPKEGRMIDLSKIQQKLHILIKEKSALCKHHDIKKTTLSERAELGMYLRLKRSWGRRSQRLTPRNQQQTQLQATIGLSSCHYLISNNEPFQPETDELNLHKYLPAHPSKSNQLSILPDVLIPWQKDKLKESRQENFHISRFSNFTNKHNHQDVWSATHQSEPDIAASQEAPKIITVNCTQNDASSGGLSFSCEINNNIQARVGELVALEHKKGEKTFKVCVLRWLKTDHHNEMEIGISFVADSAHAIAVKAVSGAGQGGDYFRALLTPDKNPRKNPTTLITPPTLYDTSTTLLVNMKNDMFHVRLTHLLESSTSYSRFRFEITDYYEDDDIPIEYVS